MGIDAPRTHAVGKEKVQIFGSISEKSILAERLVLSPELQP